MKKRTSNVSRRIVSLLMSMVLTLTLVTPAAFATEVVGGSGTAIVEGDTNPADVNTSGDNEGKDDENKDTEHGGDEQPTNPGDEDKNPDEDNGDDASKPDGDSKDKENPDGDKKDEENKNEQPTEDENDGEDEIALLNAENAADAWDGKDVNTDWYTKAEDGTGTADKPYEINTAAELAGLAALVNGTAKDAGNNPIAAANFKDKTIKLTKDIRLNEQDVPTASENPNSWTPIGKNPKKFEGTFNGDGHTIRGLYIKDSAVIKGLFGKASNATIKNLIVTGSVTVPNKANIGGIVGNAPNSTIQNCGFYGTVTGGKSNTGGVIGGGTAALNCWYYYTGSTESALGVFGGNNVGSNCYQNVDENIKKGNYAAKLNSEEVVKGLNKDNAAAGKIWAVDEAEGAVYPKLIDPPKTITLKPIFPDCAATVSVNDTELNVNNDYTYEVTGDVTITASIEGIYYADSKDEKEYSTGESGNLTQLTNGYSGEFPITLYYGTEDDFKMLAAWNSALGSNGNTATIDDASELKALARVVNSGRDSTQGMTITLNEDIDLSGIKDWTPIGTENYPFRGTFNGNKKTISNLAGDLFDVVEGGKIRQVSIDAGRMVRLLKSSSDWGKGGIVEYCRAINVNGDTAGIDSLVGKIESVTVKNSAGKDKTIVSSVSSSYVYDSKKPGIPVVEAKDELSTVTNCFYLAGDSTFGETGDSGARTAEEFAAGRVTWELNGGKGSLKKTVTWGMKDNMPFPVGGITENKVDGRVYELTLTKVYAPEGVDLALTTDGTDVTVFHNGDTWYAYCVGSSDKSKKFTVTVDTAGIGSGNVVTYGANGEPTEFAYIVNSGGVTDATKNTYYYTISKESKADTNWYDESNEKFTLSETAELFGFAKLVNEQGITFSGKTVELAADIDLTGYVWTPIGLKNSFAGTFDGGSHKVTGMSVQAKEIQRAGLFGEVSGMVRNVQVEGTINVTDAAAIYAGGIAGYVQTNGTVQNCLSMVNVYVELSGNSLTYVGGVVGFSQGTVNLCWNKGNVQGTGGTTVYTSVGGVVGSGNAANCANFGEVTGNGSTGGISGSGAVANSYNHGDVTAVNANGISGNGTVTNSYYVCKLNDTDKKAYVNNASENEVKYNEADKTYTVGEDAALLVDKLNENRDGNTPWFVNQDEGVYLPIHVLKWTGDQDDRFTGKIITITYYPNGGVNKDGVDDPISVPVTLTPDIITGGFNAKSYTILAADSETLGFKHENGVFAVWKDKSNTEYAAGTTIQVSENITLYAQWDAIWAGTGTESDPYQISDAEKLTALQTQVNDKGFSYMGKYFALPANGTITLTGEWTPIGNDTATFSGNIEGNNATINGLSVTRNDSAGLFRDLSPRGTTTYIRNLAISGTATSAYGHAGGLTAGVDEGNFTLSNITTNVAVSAPRGSAGGLIGYAGAPVGGAGASYIKVVSCTNEGTITGTTAGGIAGATDNANNARSQFALQNCRNNGSVTGTVRAGGMLGGSAGSKAVGCENSGVIVATGERAQAGGISATTLQLAESCVNTGTVNGTFVGGIAYDLPINGKATRCRNEGSVTGTNLAAGIVVHGATARGGYDAGVSFSCNFGVITAPKAYGIASRGIVKNSFTYNGGKHVAISGNKNKVTNSYYLASSATEFPATIGGEPATLDDFRSGKVAWGVDGSTGAHANYWTQGANNYPVPIGEGTSTSYYRAKAECGTGGAVSIKSSRNFAGDADNAVYGPKGMSVTVTATPKDNTFGLKSLTLDLMGTGSATALESGDSFTLGEANALVVATFASTGSGGNGGGNGGSGGNGDGSGTDTGDGAGDEDDEGLQDGLNMDVEYNIKGLVLAAYAEWGANGGGKTFAQWLKASPSVLRAFITNSLDNMAAAAKSKDTDEAKGLAALLLASLNEHSGLNSKNGDIIGKALQRYMDTGSEATFSTWLTTGSGMASGTVEEILAQYTDSLLNLTERLYANWESSGTSLTFPQWLDAQQVTMESLSENAEEPDTDTDDTQTSEAPEDVPDGQEAEGGASGGGNSVWEVIGTVVRENPIIVWSIVAVIAALVIVGAVRRYHKVKRDERDDVSSKK